MQKYFMSSFLFGLSSTTGLKLKCSFQDPIDILLLYFFTYISSIIYLQITP